MIQLVCALNLLSFGPVILPDGDQVLQEKRLKVQELRARIDKDKAEFLRVQSGPCLCGAATHADCKTKEVCEPAEDAKKAAFRDDAVAAGKELEPLLAFIEFHARVGKEIEGREAQERRLAILRDRLNAMIRKNAQKQAWREDLDDWVKESQTAQTEALRASLSMLAGPLGGIGKEIEKHQAMKERLLTAIEGARPLLAKAYESVRAARGPAVGKAVDIASHLNHLEMALQTIARKEASLEESWSALKMVGEHLGQVLQAAQAKDEILDAREKQGLLGALGAAQQALLEAVADFYIDKNVEILAETSAQTAQAIQGVRWVLDYGLASLRFYESYCFVHSIVDQVETDLKVVDKLSGEVKKAQEELLDIREECRILRESREKDTPEMARAIRQARKDCAARMAKYHSP